MIEKVCLNETKTVLLYLKKWETLQINRWYDR